MENQDTKNNTPENFEEGISPQEVKLKFESSLIEILNNEDTILKNQNGETVTLGEQEKLSMEINDNGNLDIVKIQNQFLKIFKKLDSKKTQELLDINAVDYIEQYNQMTKEEQKAFLNELENAQNLLIDTPDDVLTEEEKEKIKKEITAYERIINALETGNVDSVESETNFELFNTLFNTVEIITIPTEQVKQAFEKLKDEDKKIYIEDMKSNIQEYQELANKYKELAKDTSLKEAEKQEAEKDAEEQTKQSNKFKTFLSKLEN